MCKNLFSELKSNNFFWAFPMAKKLDSISIGLSIKWAIEVYEVIFIDLKISNKRVLKALKGLDSPTQNECKNAMVDLFINRNNITVGISRLYSALLLKEQNNYKGCSQCTAMAINSLINKTRSPYSEVVIKKYICIITKMYENYLDR